MKELKVACMKCCIRLLEYKNKVWKYKLLLVCVMIVLEINKKGWRILENYLFIMLKVIKVI